MFFTRFIVGNIFCALFACLIMLLKRLLGTRITLKFHYCIWALLLVSMLAVFLPISFIEHFHIEQPAISMTPDPATEVTAVTENIAQTYTWNSGIADAVSIADHSQLIQALTIVWVAGVLLTMGLYIKSIFRLHGMKRAANHAHESISELFEGCILKSRVRKNVVLLQSSAAQIPISFGIKPTYIILPEESLREMSGQELEHILLHELMHIRHRDILTNYVICIAQALYWCNPLVWLAFAKLREDREAYCDWAVLNTMPSPDAQLSYGYTLLHFAQQSSSHIICTETGLGGNKEQIRQRIKSIAEFRRESKKSLFYGVSVLLVVALMASMQFPVLASVSVDSNVYTPNQELRVQEIDASALFGDGDGCAVIYDQNQDTYTVYNPERMTLRVNPCSTYKIYCALNALENGIITPESNWKPWDGTTYDFFSWNSNQDLSSAMHNSVNWYFQQLDDSLGTDEITAFCRRLGYGNYTFHKDSSKFWFGSDLKVSPLEQVELLRKLYDNSFGFDENNIKAVKDSMILANNSDYRLYGKTGTGESHGVNVMGWFVGFVETDSNIYFFAVNKQDNGADGPSTVDLTYNIFDTIGIAL